MEKQGFRRWLLRGTLGVLAGCVSLVTAVFVANVWMVKSTEGRVYGEVAAVEKKEAGLVLGTLVGSPFFTNRVAAAAELYGAGKVDYLLVSGATEANGYDEPTAMKESLIQLGVPEEAIVCDFAGLRTLDSVMRAREVFGFENFVIVSQRFHNYRAVYIARRRGIDAVAFDAEDGPVRKRYYAESREALARVLAMADLHLVNRKARFGADGSEVRPKIRKDAEGGV